MKPEQSNLTNNPNHPRIRCVDGVFGDADDGPWMGAACEGVGPPYRVFDILNQEHVGPEFKTQAEAEAHMEALGGAWAPGW